MSVLNDIVTLTGEHIRILAEGTCADDAKQFFRTVRRLPGPRFERIEYSVTPEECNVFDLSYTNHYWVDEDGNVWWGTPGGTWGEYLDRILADPLNWAGDTWLPSTKRECKETRARDMLLASFLFPFVKHAKHEDPCIKHGLLPALANINMKNLLVGTAAVHSLVLDAATRGPITQELSELGGNWVKESTKNFQDFNSWHMFFAAATSTNPEDAMAGGARASKSDWASAEKGDIYLSLAALARVGDSITRAFSGKGRMKRAMVKHSLNVKALAAEIHRAGRKQVPHILGVRHDPALKRARDFHRAIVAKPMHDLKGSGNSTSLAYRTGRTSAVSALGSRNLVLFRVDEMYYLLTTEVLKALKFTAMSHSMWHVYAATIAVEYSAPKAVKVSTVPDSGLSSAAGQLAMGVDSILIGILGPRATTTKQEVVPYSVVRKGIADLWELYVSIVDQSLQCGHHDYVGRYLHELFSVYTSELAGALAVSGKIAQTADVLETYSPMGFTVATHIAKMSRIFKTLPMTAIQDFGRLSKIVGPYEVNPIYSFVDRVKKMRVRSPIGAVEFKSEFDYTVRPHTDQENIERWARFRSGARVLLVIADLRTTAAAVLDDEDREKLADAPWPEVIQRMMAAGKALRSRATELHVPAFPVPAERAENAKRQAHELLVHGTQPTEPYAGAFLETENILPYVERGDPDIAIIKPTSVPSGDLSCVFSNISTVPRSTPTRDTDGNRMAGAGNMVTDFLMGIFPSRSESLSYVRTNTVIASTSDKIETNKYPLKTRVITGVNAAARRIQGEFEHNNGKTLVNVPAFIVGVDPGKLKKSVYASMREDASPGMTRVRGSLDISSFSAGMDWEFQSEVNAELRHAYDGGSDNFDQLEKCTIGSLMVRSAKGLRLPSVNTRGSNYEGLDGKRNTFGMCVIWYLTRCEAYDKGVDGVMRAWVYIDDGAFSIEVLRENLQSTVDTLRTTMISTYVRYGHALSILKTVFSESYMQLLNEVFYMGLHVGYGFRALCHTASQTFPVCATVGEELAVITGGVRGAAVSGGHPFRLAIGLAYILHLYLNGVVGTKGEAINQKGGFLNALHLNMPSICNGYNHPNWTQLFSNLAGNRDVEKLARVSLISRAIRRTVPTMWPAVRSYMKATLSTLAQVDTGMVPDRVTIAHPATGKLGAHGRDMIVAKTALNMCQNFPVKQMLRDYIRDGGKPGSKSFVAVVSSVIKDAPARLPIGVVEKALKTDQHSAIATMIGKITSGGMIGKLLPWKEVWALDVKYRNAARNNARHFHSCMTN